jgi:hypothetical protein
MKVVLVTGGRDYADADKIAETLSKIAPDVVLEGGQTGADQLARRWAEKQGLFNAIVPAN